CSPERSQNSWRAPVSPSSATDGCETRGRAPNSVLLTTRSCGRQPRKRPLCVRTDARATLSGARLHPMQSSRRARPLPTRDAAPIPHSARGRHATAGRDFLAPPSRSSPTDSRPLPASPRGGHGP
ncbi:MAG: hypothetical protein AVDCRST_MAG19-3546, partial [uncultured Thermomicrobiales bacterium]